MFVVVAMCTILTIGLMAAAVYWCYCAFKKCRYETLRM